MLAFGLRAASFEELPEAPFCAGDDKAWDDRLGTLLWQAIGDNPALRWPGIYELEKHLDGHGRLPLKQVYMFLEHTCESESITRTASLRMHQSMLSHMVEHNVPSVWPEGWRAVVGRMQQVMVHTWIVVFVSPPV